MAFSSIFNPLGSPAAASPRPTSKPTGQPTQPMKIDFRGRLGGWGGRSSAANTTTPTDPTAPPRPDIRQAAAAYGLPPEVLAMIGYNSGDPGDPIYGIAGEVTENIMRRLDPNNPEYDPTALSQKIYEASATPLRREYEQVQKQNIMDLERAGLATSGAGYSAQSPYGTTQTRFLDTLGDLSNRSYLQAVDLGLNREQQALMNALNYWSFHSGQDWNQVNLGLQQQQLDAERDAAEAARSGALWGGIGSALGGIAGVALGNPAAATGILSGMGNIFGAGSSGY